MPRKKLTLLILFFFLILIIIPNSYSYTNQNNMIYVPDDYPTIQEAINNAKQGDTINNKAIQQYSNFFILWYYILLEEILQWQFVYALRPAQPELYT